MPLEFDRTKQALQWNNGSRTSIPGTFVTEGVRPEGSTWAMNPIPPRCLSGNCRSVLLFSVSVWNSSKWLVLELKELYTLQQ